MKSIIIIPARMASNRLPNKPLIEVGGKSLVQWTYKQARQTKADYVLVASPDREICRHCEDVGIPWRPTCEDCPTGTHRCGELFRQFRGEVLIDIVVNWQCDEIAADPEDVNELIGSVRKVERITTLVGDLKPEDLNNPNVVKAICFDRGDSRNLIAHWFSRAPMGGSLAHIGVYAFPTWALKGIYRHELTSISLAERLEQLTWIEKGYLIGAIKVENVPLAINTPEDLEEFKRRIEKGDLPDIRDDCSNPGGTSCFLGPSGNWISKNVN